MRPLYPPRSLRSRPSQREGGLDVLDVGKTSDKVPSDRIAKQHLPTKNDEGPQREGGLDVLDVGKTSDKVSSDRIAKQHLPTKIDEGPTLGG